MFYHVHLAMRGFKLTTLVVIGTDCLGSCKSNYHTIMTTTSLLGFGKHFVLPLHMHYKIQ